MLYHVKMNILDSNIFFPYALQIYSHENDIRDLFELQEWMETQVIHIINVYNWENL